VDAQIGRPDATGRGREGGQELGAAKAQLLGDDRRVGLDVEREPFEPDDPAGAGRGGPPGGRRTQRRS